MERLRNTIDETGVCSFAGRPAEHPNVEPLCLESRGLCHMFEIAREPETFLDALPVEYSVDYPVLNWVKDFDKGKDTLHIVRRKHKGWEDEKEWRIIKFKKADTHIKFLPAALRAIIAGCRVKEGTLENLKTLLAKRKAPRMPPITIHQCYQHQTHYRIVISRSSRAPRANHALNAKPQNP